MPGFRFFILYALVLGVAAAGLGGIWGLMRRRQPVRQLLCRATAAAGVCAGLCATGMLAAALVFFLAHINGWFYWYG